MAGRQAGWAGKEGEREERKAGKEKGRRDGREGQDRQKRVEMDNVLHPHVGGCRSRADGRGRGGRRWTG
eukprot:6212898-Pleurochrysis_carterae.AAC.12